MKYNWDLKQIKNLKKEAIKGLFNSEFTFIEKALIKESLKAINEIEASLIFKKNIIPYYTFSKYIDKTHCITKNIYQEYKKIPLDMRLDILGATNVFCQLVDLYQDIDLSKINLSNDKLIELSYNFFKWLPTENKEYEQLFLQYTNPNNHLLKFTKISNDVVGSCYSIYYPTFLSYFSITRENSIDDFSTLNHELSHGIFFKNGTCISLNNNSYFLYELEGHFFDFLSIEFLKDKISQEEIDQLKYSRFHTQLCNFINFYISSFAINLFDKNKEISIVPIQKKVLEKNLPFNITESNLINSLRENPTTNFKYLFSYFTSLDLESIYEFDPEYAFYLFEQIRTNKTDDVYHNLREHGITFMDDGYESLQKTIKYINKLGRK